MFNVNRALTKHLLWAAIITAIAVVSISTLLVSVSTYPDPGWGFLTWKSIQHGGNFNMLPEPDSDNIAKDTYRFLTWWSPGQYLIPGGIAAFTGLKIGWGMVITSIIFTISGVAGFYFLFDKLGFNRKITLLSVLVLCSQIQTLLPLLVYNGGEPLIFGVAPWFLYCCLDFKLKPFRLLLLILLSWIGFIAKSSFLLITISGFLFIFFKWISIKPTFKELAIKTSWLLFAGLMIVIPIFFLFLQKGDNPSTGAKGFSITVMNFLFPAAIPFLGAFSVDEIFNRFFHPNYIAILPPSDALFYGLAFLLVIFLLAKIYLNRIGSVSYRCLLFTTYFFFLFFFLMQYCRHAAISMEGRHYHILSLLFIPGVLQLINQTKITAVKRASQLLVLATCLYTWNNYFHHLKLNRNEALSANTRVHQDLLDNQTLLKLHQLDNQYQHQALFVVMSPEIGLEIEQNRILVMSFDGIAKGQDEETYDGRVKKLFLFVPTLYTKGKSAQLIKSAFTDYKSFREEKISDRYMLYTGL